jgi:cytochrome b pre-mRNA-processing protein 3
MVLGGWLQRRKSNRWAVDRLHQSILQQSLRPDFYDEGGARDTFSGRFEMVALNAALVFRRMRSLGPTGRDLAQECFDALFDGFDEALRDIGTGDLSVGKKIRKLGEAFYGRARAYDAAMEGDDPDSLAAAIARNLVLPIEQGRRFAEYARSVETGLLRHEEAQLLAGEIAWPRPLHRSDLS